MQRAAEERREAGAEDDADIGKIGVATTPSATARSAFVDQRLHQLAAEAGEVGLS